MKKNINRHVNTEENNSIMTTYKEHVSEPWFTLISLGLKSVEGRKNKGKFKEMKIGDTIEWFNNDIGNRNVVTEVIGKNVYPTFREYLEKEGIENCLPSIRNIDDGINIYYKYYTPADEKEYGVVAIVLKLLET